MSTLSNAGGSSNSGLPRRIPRIPDQSDHWDIYARRAVNSHSVLRGIVREYIGGHSFVVQLDDIASKKADDSGISFIFNEGELDKAMHLASVLSLRAKHVADDRGVARITWIGIVQGIPTRIMVEHPTLESTAAAA